MVQFLFADQVLDTDRRELHRGSAPIAVEPQVFDLLTFLMQNRDRVVPCNYAGVNRSPRSSLI